MAINEGTTFDSLNPLDGWPGTPGPFDPTAPIHTHKCVLVQLMF